MRLHIVIPVHNQNDFYYRTLMSIVKTYPVDFNYDLHLHVIDCDSFVAIKPPAIQGYPNIEATLTRLNKNRGVTYPWNLGLKFAISQEADAICISNSDVVFGPKTIEHCLEAISIGHPVVYPNSIQGGPLPADFDRRSLKASELETKDNLKVTGGFAGWCFFLSREAVEKVGYFDDQFTLWYQDTDYHWRLSAAGIKPVQVESCLLHHFESKTIKSMPDGFECHGWRARDAERFGLKWPRK